MTMQQEINDLVRGKHKGWHLQSLLTRTYGELGWEYQTETQWEFVAGFDYEQDAVITKADCERSVREGLQYGGNDYELRVVRKS